MTNAIEVRDLRKSYGRTKALDGLDLTVRTGEVHAFLGPNGAGKTTTIRILLGLLRKDGGEVSLLGGDPWQDAVRLHARLAYVPGDVTWWPGLTGGEIIDLLARPVSLDGLPGVRAADIQGTRLHCEVDHGALNDVLARLTAVGVLALTRRPPTLEELFLRHYSAERSGSGAPG